MPVYLVQHGLSRPKEEDPERSLSDKGEEEVRLIGGVAQNYRVAVKTIFHSGKKRAEQTAGIFSELLTPSGGCHKRDGLAPMDDVKAVADKLQPDSGLMLVGHLPFMEKLLSVLVTGEEVFTPFKFQNGGIVCVDKGEDDNHWHVKWALMPNVGEGDKG